MKTTLLTLLATAAFAGSASAAPISGNGDPVLPGSATMIDFDDLGGSYVSSLTVGNVKFSGIGNLMSTDTTYAGMYNTRGTAYIGNSEGNTDGLRFDFANTVNAFAFNWGASDYDWVLTAYDSAGAALESLVVRAVGGSNDGEYFGLARAGMAYAELIAAGPGDYVMLDNFSFVEEGRAADVPEPGSLALFGAALAGLVLGRKRSNARAA